MLDDQHHHSHGQPASGCAHHLSVDVDSQRRVKIVLAITFLFMLIELIGGWYANSLALIADGMHMLSDCFALLLALSAFILANRAPDLQRSFGYQRMQVIAAFINGVLLFVLLLGIFITALERLFNPPEVAPQPMIWIGLAGVVVNFISFLILAQGDGKNLNLQGALLHVFGDMLGSGAAIIAGIIILLTSWHPIDPLLSVVAGILILRSAWSLIKQSLHILMEGAPQQIDHQAIRRALAELPTVLEVHDLHLWCLTPQQILVSVHLVVNDQANRDTLLQAALNLLQNQFLIAHATIQIEGVELPKLASHLHQHLSGHV